MRALLSGSVVTLSAAFLLVTLSPAWADDILAHARALDHSGKRAEALQELQKYLVEHPQDTDARGFYGAVLSWDGQYPAARAELERVLLQNADDRDALSALISVELWSGHPERAEELANGALQHRPGDVDLLLARARALRLLKRRDDTREALNQVLQVDPTHTQAREMQRTLEDDSRVWEASVEHSSEWLSDGQDPWQESQLSLKRATRAGPVIARFLRGQRFALDSSQVALEFYPTIRRGTWAALNLGYSPDARLYPRYRFAGDLNQALGKGFEAVMGYSRLSFAHSVNIYTPALNKYYRNWLFTGRVFLIPGSTGTSKSLQFATRRYFRDGGSYVGVRFGRGSSPLETRSVSDTEILHASSFIGEIYKIFGHRWVFTARSGASREDRVGRSGLDHYIADVALSFRF